MLDRGSHRSSIRIMLRQSNVTLGPPDAAIFAGSKGHDGQIFQLNSNKLIGEGFLETSQSMESTAHFGRGGVASSTRGCIAQPVVDLATVSHRKPAHMHLQTNASGASECSAAQCLSELLFCRYIVWCSGLKRASDLPCPFGFLLLVASRRSKLHQSSIGLPMKKRVLFAQVCACQLHVSYSMSNTTTFECPVN